MTLAIFLATGGRHKIFVTMATLQTAFKLSFVSLILWIWSLTFVKVSVCLLLLKIQDTPKWKAGIYTLMAIVFVIAVVGTICQFLQCHAPSDYWEFAKPGSCVSQKKIIQVSYVISSKKDQLHLALDLSSSF